MSLHNPTYDAAARAHEEAPDDGPDYLTDKPKGLCPWCNGEVSNDDGDPLESRHDSPWPQSCQWDEWESVDANRLRYAAEREAEAKLEERIAREARRSGGEVP